jgi:pyrimidine-specific ribonucleoside hydrolase
MKMLWILFLFFSSEIFAPAQPIPVKDHHHIVIDTDCGLDDLRAIGILLSCSNVIIDAVLTCDGNLSPNEGAEKVAMLVRIFDKQAPIIATGRALPGIDPAWRKFNQGIQLGVKDPAAVVNQGALYALTAILQKPSEKITLVCLGPLTLVAQLFEKHPDLASNLERIIWYNESVAPLKGFNYACDTASARAVLASGKRIDVVRNLYPEEPFYDSELENMYLTEKTDLAGLMHILSPHTMASKQKNHSGPWDELVSLYLINPELFDMSPLRIPSSVRMNTDHNLAALREVMKDLLCGSYEPSNNVVFKRFPDNPRMFAYDIRFMVDSVIALYGIEEWKAVVMTDEFHGHLGVFSIMGAKMGIRAREYFKTGPDELRVVSFAGNHPPYSCMNDGIQVSTGATLGMGTIQLSHDSISMPSAIFTHEGISIKLSLKQEFLDTLNADIGKGIRQFGLMDDGYWKMIRRNALKYWLEWNRNKIFDLEHL